MKSAPFILAPGRDERCCSFVPRCLPRPSYTRALAFARGTFLRDGPGRLIFPRSDRSQGRDETNDDTPHDAPVSIRSHDGIGRATPFPRLDSIYPAYSSSRRDSPTRPIPRGTEPVLRGQRPRRDGFCIGEVSGHDETPPSHSPLSPLAPRPRAPGSRSELPSAQCARD